MDLNQFSRQLLTEQNPERFAFSNRKIIEDNFRGIISHNGLEQTNAFSSVNEIIGNTASTCATLAGVFWQVMLSSSFFQNFLLEYVANGEVFTEGRSILSMTEIVNPRYDLLLLRPDLMTADSFSVSLDDILRNSKRTGESPNTLYHRWLEGERSKLDIDSEAIQVPSEFSSRGRLLLEALSHPAAENFISEAIKYQEFALLVGPMPQTVRNAAIARPGIGISLEEGGKSISSAGIVTIDKQGRTGVTAALHGVFPSPEMMDEEFNQRGLQCALNKKIYVNGRPGTIVNAHYLTDSCFIEVDTTGFTTNINIIGALDRSPYENEKVTFESYGSSKNTAVTTIDIAATSPVPHRQVRLYTKPVTDPGDSGSALFNKDNYVLGFSHARTGIGEDIEFSEWIWANSVYKALQL